MLPCPKGGCRGLVVGTACGMCGTTVCRSCHAALSGPAGGEHVCNDAELATAREIMSRTKPCPACGVRIFKEFGCDQMWCTSCHTCFSWSTLKVLRNVHIHNPHFHEWRMRHGGGDGCNDEGIYRGHGDGPVAVELARVQHLIAVTRIDGADDLHLRDKLIMEYLVGAIDEKVHKRRLQELEKRRQKLQHMSQIWEMFSDAAKDVLRQCTDTNREETLAQLHELRRFTNKAYEDAAKIYQSLAPAISDNWVRR